jgi:radical SAM superfamily enzyme YgiQ (UPF0313 family)
MKVMFIIPKVESPIPRRTAPHLGIAYLSSILTQNKIEVGILDLVLGYSIRQVFQYINEFEPDLIGITSYSYGYQKTYQLIKEIKSKTNIKIVIGGPHASCLKTQILKDTQADFVIKGEGEKTIIELCNALKLKEEDFSIIKGLIWRKKDGEIIENEDMQWIEDLDNLPFPDYESFELTKYTSFQERFLYIITSRGCPYRCIFCTIGLCMGHKFRPRSPENVVAELEYWYKKGWRRFEFSDDCFSFDINRAKQICELICKRGLKIHYQLGNGLRVDKVDKGLLKKMKESGCYFISYGLESGNSQILRKIKKGITVHQIKETVDSTRKVGIKVGASFIIGHPGESYSDGMESLKLAKNLQLDFLYWYNLIPYPGSELYKWVKKNATLLYSPEIYLNRESYFSDTPIFETEIFSSKERKKILRQGFSLSRKINLQSHLPKSLGRIACVISKWDILWNLGLKIFRRTRWGSRIFPFLKRNE